MSLGYIEFDRGDRVEIVDQLKDLENIWSQPRIRSQHQSNEIFQFFRVSRLVWEDESRVDNCEF